MVTLPYPKDKVNIVLDTVFLVAIIGKKVEGEPYDKEKDPRGIGPLPTIPDDEGRVEKFNSWCVESDVVSIGRIGQIGGGRLLRFFEMKDKEKLTAWFNQMYMEEEK